MNIYALLEQLSVIYPHNKKDEDFEPILMLYAEQILGVIQKSKKKYNFQKVLAHLMQTYKYRTFPTLPDILEALPYGEITEVKYSGKEGTEIKRIINGHEYSFTIVPSTWDAKTISELDNEIRLKEEMKKQLF